MRVLVGYESVMGNTRQIAEAIAAGAAHGAPGAVVHCVSVGTLSPDPPDVDLLVVGAPTHLFGLPSERTRRMWIRGIVDASRRGERLGRQRLEPGAAGPGLREWLDDLPGPGLPIDADLLRAVRPDLSPRPRWAAAFDTRLDRPFTGSAARRAARLLRHHGFRLAAPPEGFLVEDVPGPLRPGEGDRAFLWGAALTEVLVPVMR